MKILSKLKLFFIPTDEWDAVNKKYVDDLVSSNSGEEMNLSNYLAKNNTELYSPVHNYNPATKKYVDDAVSDAIGDLGEILDAINRTVI